MLSLISYSAGSILATAFVCVNAYQKYEQFYPAGVHLVTAKLSQMVLCNFILMCTILAGLFIKRVTLGSLRASEVEHLLDRLWPTIFDTLLLTTIFRAELSPYFIFLFGILVFVSIFHWLAKDRVDYIATSPVVSAFTLIRLLGLLVGLFLFDIAYVYYVLCNTIIEGPSALFLFGFEYGLLVWSISTTIAKFIFNLIERQYEGQWHAKTGYVLFTESIEEGLKFFTLIAFFYSILTYYGLPLHILRRLIVSFSLFQKRITELSNYTRIIRNMNTLFPPATPEELAENPMCIICREDMAEARKLPCNHLFHASCLRGWLGRSHECPTCRFSLLPYLRGRNGQQPNRVVQIHPQDPLLAQLQAQMQLQQQHQQQQQQLLQQQGAIPPRQQPQGPIPQPQPQAPPAAQQPRHVQAAAPPQQPFQAPVAAQNQVQRRQAQEAESQRTREESETAEPVQLSAPPTYQVTQMTELMEQIDSIQHQVALISTQLEYMKEVLSRSAQQEQMREKEEKVEVKKEAIEVPNTPKSYEEEDAVHPEEVIIETRKEKLPKDLTVSAPDVRQLSEDSEDDDKEMIRRRRLLRFSQQNAAD